MAGLVPFIHVLALQSREDVDARHKAGHDTVSVAAHSSVLKVRICLPGLVLANVN